MSGATGKDWSDIANERIAGAGLRRSAPRQKVIELLAGQGCALTVLEMDSRLKGVGRATVYRAIEQLEELGLAQKVDLGGNAFGYEKVDPGGGHHHHIVCTGCGKVIPFEDKELEKAIHEVSKRDGFQIESHEITLRGTCEDC